MMTKKLAIDAIYLGKCGCVCMSLLEGLKREIFKLPQGEKYE